MPNSPYLQGVAAGLALGLRTQADLLLAYASDLETKAREFKEAAHNLNALAQNSDDLYGQGDRFDCPKCLLIDDEDVVVIAIENRDQFENRHQCPRCKQVYDIPV